MRHAEGCDLLRLNVLSGDTKDFENDIHRSLAWHSGKQEMRRVKYEPSHFESDPLKTTILEKAGSIIRLREVNAPAKEFAYTFRRH